MEGQQIYPHAKQTIVTENDYVGKSARPIDLPTYETHADRLPRPFWSGHDDAIRCYDKVWRLAFQNLRNPQEGSGMVSPFISTAFNGFLFMWDSCFILMFARYGKSAFDFQGTLDNLYSKQHEDGFISREIHEVSGIERFERHDTVSTGPNIMSWCEWEYYKNYHDIDRLKRIFPALLGYHRWMRNYRSWPDGSCWSTGLGCGMDNLPRCPNGYDHMLHHGFMSWVDATAQALLSAKCLKLMGEEIGRLTDLDDIRHDIDFLTNYLNSNMWNETCGIYTDRFRDGTLSDVITVGGFWPILAGATDDTRAERMLQMLEDPKHFNRPHRVPALSASHPEYNAENGGYWKGGVWAPTNYMVLRGLRSLGTNRAAKLAHEIGLNHVENITKVYNDTETVWENYTPEAAKQGQAKPDFVGWSGMGPVAILFEEVFGLQPDIPNHRLVLDVRLVDEYGVENYPFSDHGLLNINVAKRGSVKEKPEVRVQSTMALTLDIHWDGGSEELEIKPSGVVCV